MQMATRSWWMGDRSLTLFLVTVCVCVFFSACENSNKAVRTPAPKPVSSQVASSHDVEGKASEAVKPPRIVSLKLLPVSPRKGDELHVEVEAERNSDAPVTFSYQWSVNGDILNTEDGPNLKMPFVKGDKVVVTITPEEAGVQGVPLIQTTIIGNSPPVVSPALTDATIAGNHYSGKIQAQDPDGDPLTYTLLEGPKGMTVNQKTGVITWDFQPEDAGMHTLSISVKDNDNAEVIMSLPLKLEFGSKANESEKQ